MVQKEKRKRRVKNKVINKIRYKNNISIIIIYIYIMFNNYESAGKHMVCDFKCIKNKELLNNCYLLKNMMKEICKKYDFQILNEMEHTFYPIGCTIIFLLSESHMSIHTFPEKQYLSFDIYTCRQYTDNSVYTEIYNNIINRLDASLENSTFNIIERFF
jgi:S-adenosylmethionine decarboxylase proenzyme